MGNLTPEQIAEKARWDALTPAQKGIETKAKKAAEKAANKPEEKTPEDKSPEKPKAKDGFLNPFTAGVTYDDFVKAIPSGKTVAEYCKGKLTEDEINWISEEVENFKKNKKK
jgi:hypothetical protein